MYNTITTILLALLIFAFAFCGKWRMKKDLTFGFYLYHMVFINVALEIGFTSLQPYKTGVLLIACLTMLTIGTAWLTQRYIEQPAAKLLLKEK